MREAASRGFWMTSYAPYGYKRVHVQDGPAMRPTLELNPPADAVVRRIFDMVLQGKSILDVVKTLNAEGIPTTNGKKWLKTTIHSMLDNEAYTGAVVWGINAKDKAPPVRVEDAHPAIITKGEFHRAKKLLGSRAPKRMNPRRASSPYLLSGLLRCETCGKAMTAAEAKSGKYTYYVCHSLLKRGSGTCKTPRLNAKNFEELIVNEIRENVLTESNIRDLVKLLDEEMDGVAASQRQKLESIDGELEEVKKQLGRVLALRSEERQRRRGPGFGPHRGTPGAQGESGDRPRGGKGAIGRPPSHAGQRRHRRLLRRGDERVPQDQRADRDQSLRPVLRQEDRG